MVELISKVSKGSVMDQVYIPKKRAGLPVGSYVVIQPIERRKDDKAYFYNTDYLEPLKVETVKKIFRLIEDNAIVDNILITGSFLEEGFRFRDIDVMLISDVKLDTKHIAKMLKDSIGAEFHLIVISNKALGNGLSTDPLYNVMLSRCVARKRLIYRSKRMIKYKLLDLHLLKSRLLLDNFDILKGEEKYEMLRNLFGIKLFIEGKEVSKESIDISIVRIFGSIDKIRDNLLEKSTFLIKYRKIFKMTRNKILEGIQYEQK